MSYLNLVNGSGNVDIKPNAVTMATLNFSNNVTPITGAAQNCLVKSTTANIVSSGWIPINTPAGVKYIPVFDDI